jgi:hypothetical protein
VQQSITSICFYGTAYTHMGKLNLQNYDVWMRIQLLFLLTNINSHNMNTGSAWIWFKYVLTREWSIQHVKTCLDFFFFFTARAHTTKSTVKILAANTHYKYFLKIAENGQYCSLSDPWRNVHP